MAMARGHVRREIARITRIGTAILLATTHVARAGPPFITDDPEPVELRHWECDAGSLFTHDRDGSSGTAPQVEIDYGALPNLQVHLIAQLAFATSSTRGSRFGLGDTELGAKYRFIQETDYRPQVGEFVLLEVPSGNADQGLGNGNTQILVPVWVQKSIGRWLMYGGGGHWFTLGTPSRHWWFLGYVLQRQVLENLAIGAEIFHSTAKDADTAAETRFNVGFVFDFDRLHHVMGSAGRGLADGNLFQCYVAYQLTFP